MKRKRDKKNLSMWAISEEIIDYLISNLNENDTIIEFGSGTGSIEIENHFDLWSIEHNKVFLLVHKNTLNNFYAPIKKYKKVNPTLKTDINEYEWYDEDVIKNVLNKINYNCLLVDGPPGCIGREGFLYNLNEFNTNCLIIIDDVNRDEENKLLYKVSKRLGCKYTVYHCSDGKSFGVIDNR
jgi:hypothetical protein